MNHSAASPAFRTAACQAIRLVVFVFVCALGLVPVGASALEGVYGGPECLGMRFDFRADGQVFATVPGSAETAGTYRDTGDRIAIALPRDPGVVLVRSGSALTLRLPQTPISPAATLHCTTVVDPRTAKTMPPDPRLFGCWQVDGQEIVDQAGLAPRHVGAPKDAVCQSRIDATQAASLCRRTDGSIVGGSVVSRRTIGPNTVVARVVENRMQPTAVGQETVGHYEVQRETLIGVFYGAEADPASKVFKREVRSHSVPPDRCIVESPHR